MNDLLNADESQAIVKRIESLTPQSNAEWGKMDVAQALAHCVPPLEIALGDRTLKRGLIGLLFGGMARKKLLKETPFDRNMPTAPSFKVTDTRDLDREKKVVTSLVVRFTEAGRAGLEGKVHPFFGALTPEEWSHLQWKHLDHHLRQFGA